MSSSKVTFKVDDKDATLHIEAADTDLIIPVEKLENLIAEELNPGDTGSFYIEVYDVDVDDAPGDEPDDTGDDFESRLRRLEDLAKRAREQFGF